MYCPQCGGTIEDTARNCSICGLDIEQYRRQWASPPGEQANGQAPAPYQQPAQEAYQQPYQQQYQPPYQQQYEAPYQAPYQSPQYRPISSTGAIPHIPSYLGWAIAVLIVCFWPTGIAAVVYASQVGNKLVMGDIAGARESSRKAKMWCWITFGIGIAGIVIAIIAAVVLSAASISTF